jgi:phospholipase C
VDRTGQAMCGNFGWSPDSDGGEVKSGQPPVPKGANREGSMQFRRNITNAVLCLAATLVAIGCAVQPPAPKAGLEKIQHVIVIFAENRSFDHLYGLFPGANGLASATPDQYTQVDRDGKPMAELPPAWKGKDPDPAFPHRVPNRPFRLDAPPYNLPLSQQVRSPVHRYYQNIEQINGGRNDLFAAISDAGGYAMAYYDGSSLPMW